MSIHLIVAVISFCIAMSAAIIASLLQYRMIGEINRKSPEDAQISYIGFYFEKNLRIYREYRRLYPTSALHKYWLTGVATMFAGMLGVAICFLTAA